MLSNILLTVDTFDNDGEPLKLCLLKPNVRINKSCDIEYKKAWIFLMRQGIPTHKTLLKEFEDKGVWTKDHQKELNELNVKIGIQTQLMEKFIRQDKKEDARKAALEIIDLRNKSYEMIEIYNQAFNFSCEGGANEIRHEAYVAYATVYENDLEKNYFKDYADFKDRRDERATTDMHYAYMQHVINENQGFIRDLPENKWLIDIGYLTKELKRNIPKKENVKMKKIAQKKKRKTKE